MLKYQYIGFDWYSEYSIPIISFGILSDHTQKQKTLMPYKITMTPVKCLQQ